MNLIVFILFCKVKVSSYGKNMFIPVHNFTNTIFVSFMLRSSFSGPRANRLNSIKKI